MTTINNEIMKFDCIIVLANEMDKEGNLNLESISRIKLARDSYFNNPSTTLITCGWNYRKDSKLFIGDVMKNYAVKLGVPSDKILAEINSRDTVGDAFFTKLNILKNMAWNTTGRIGMKHPTKISFTAINQKFSRCFTVVKISRTLKASCFTTS